jgi:hypothetical protein
MQDESNQFPEPLDPYTEHLVVLGVLDQRGPHTRSSLESSLDDIDREMVRDALRELESVGVVVIDGERVAASQATGRLDRLHMICI